MDELILRDFRCFRGEHVIPLAPITVLVGENSTGKSTLLALARIAWDLAFGVTGADFNEEPFQLGSYEELAHNNGGRGKRAPSFSVGFSDSSALARLPGPTLIAPGATSLVGTFSALAGQPTLSKAKLERGPWRIEVQVKPEQIEVGLSTPAGMYRFKEEQSAARLRLFKNAGDLLSYVGFILRMGAGEVFLEGNLPRDDELSALAGILYFIPSRSEARPVAVAPIRSRPKRTYDPLREVRSPEGDHVPMLLARLGSADQSAWDRLAIDLSSYGKASGLFEEVVVHRFEGGESSPFQLRVRLAGQKKEINLVDVGYGVSQVLPILVDALVEQSSGFFLMQQPEVHLHPRAQAELGTFIASLARSRDHRFMVETHSDYLVDRLRMEVKNKTIKPEMVAILFLERQGSEVKIHRIEIDSSGNIVGQPDSYRRFFLEEELRAIL